MFFNAYAFKGQVHVFAKRMKIVSHRPEGQVQYGNSFILCTSHITCLEALLETTQPDQQQRLQNQANLDLSNTDILSLEAAYIQGFF